MSRKRSDEDCGDRMLGAATAMTEQDGATSVDDRLLEEAADWLVGLVSGAATDEDAERLVEWRSRSAAHEAAFREVSGVRSYAVVAAHTKKPVNRRAILSAGGGGALAVLAGVGIARPPLGLWPSYAELMADHRTTTGGRLAFDPIPGVNVELSSRTAVSLIDNGHGIRLITGEFYVSAAREAGVFRVETNGFRLAAQGAEFNVRVLPHHERVVCVRGALRCEVQGQVTALAPDQALSIGANGAARREPIDAEKDSAWRRGLLVFEGAPLGQVVDQINLYRPGRIVLADPDLAKVQLNAVFHIAQIDNSIAQIEQLVNARARYVAGGVVLLG